MARLCMFLVLALSAGCLPPRVYGRLRTQASYDLSCPEGKLTLRELGTRTSQGVEGCGKRARYVMASTGDWVLNTLDGLPAGSSQDASAATP